MRARLIHQAITNSIVLRYEGVAQRGDEAFLHRRARNKAVSDIHHPILEAVDDRKYRVSAAMGAVAMEIDPAAMVRVYDVDLADLSDPQAAEGVDLTTGS